MYAREAQSQCRATLEILANIKTRRWFTPANQRIGHHEKHIYPRHNDDAEKEHEENPEVLGVGHDALWQALVSVFVSSLKIGPVLLKPRSMRRRLTTLTYHLRDHKKPS